MYKKITQTTLLTLLLVSSTLLTASCSSDPTTRTASCSSEPTTKYSEAKIENKLDEIDKGLENRLEQDNALFNSIQELKETMKLYTRGEWRNKLRDTISQYQTMLCEMPSNKLLQKAIERSSRYHENEIEKLGKNQRSSDQELIQLIKADIIVRFIIREELVC